MWGRLLICGRLAIGLFAPERRRLPTAAQEAILPHNASAIREVADPARRGNKPSGRFVSYRRGMPVFSKWIACSSLAVLVALYVVGAVSHGSLRHEVQTLPLWFPIVWGFRHRELAQWSALPCFIVWLASTIACGPSRPGE